MTPTAKTSSTSLANRHPLSAYVEETKRYPLLSADEEHELALRVVEQGDARAARRLVESNLRLVVKIAYEYQRAHYSLLDVVQEGNLGLIHAVAKFDPHRGVKLSSYAIWWIRAYILKFILNNHRMVRLGTTQAQRKLFFNLNKEKERLEAQGFSPDSATLAKALDVKEREVVEMQKRLRTSDASFDAPYGSADGGESRTRYDITAADTYDRPDDAVEESEFLELLRGKLAAFEGELQGREASIFRHRLLADEPLSLRELGEQFGVSRERTRQIEKRLVERLKKYLVDELGTAVNIDAPSLAMAA